MENLQTQDRIDFRCELHAIRQKFGPKYFREPKAAQEAARLWGYDCNEHGVLMHVTEKIRVEHKGYSATVRLYESAKGYWHVSTNFTAPDSGSGNPASVWDGLAFTNGLAARRYAVGRLLDRCDTQKRYGDTPALATFKRKLEAELTPQLALF
ncbi:hypothetical protein O4H48_14415 [Rhodobacteraceae bacterium G21628-S1]|nr:hypothetical protein [Rhodobacteraceae bacterium G21628-S1]